MNITPAVNDTVPGVYKERMSTVSRGRVSGDRSIPRRWAWRGYRDPADTGPQSRGRNMRAVTIRRDSLGFVVAPVSHQIPSQQMRLRSPGRYNESKCRSARVDNRTDRHGNVARLLKNGLQVGDWRGIVDHHFGEAAGIGVVPDLGRRTLG